MKWGFDMVRRCSQGIGTILLILPGLAWTEELPDLRTVAMDLTLPALVEGDPAPGKRVRAVHPSYAGTEVYHVLYLPTDWKEGGRYPVIVEYPGNGPYRNTHGDVCTGQVEDCHLGFGISQGMEVIWVCLPFISADGQRNQNQWWGDVEATVAYCRGVVADVIGEHGGDPERLFLAGFSRGAIACNYIGLHDEKIASLWRGFMCHSHYDGVRSWGYEGDDSASARVRLARLKGRPQFIMHEGSVATTRQYLQEACPDGDFEFVDLPYRNHTDTWALRDVAARDLARQWFRRHAYPAPIE